MRAAVLVEPGRIELRDLPGIAPSAGSIVVRVRAALTDGTDLKAYRRGHPRMPMPTRFGHEFSGDVAAIGSDVKNFTVGDAVMSVHTAPCRRCYWCNKKEEELCESLMQTMVLGAYAEYVELPERIVTQNCYPKPPDLPYVTAAFLEPLSCVVHSLDYLGVKSGDSVAVIGDGGFGLLHALLLQRIGADVVLAGHRDERLQLSKRFGIANTVNTRSGDLRKALDSATSGRGADAVIECTGRLEAWEEAPSLVRRGGAVSFFGGLPSGTRASFDAARMHYDEVRLVSPFHFTPRAVFRARELLVRGQLDPMPLVTQTVSLDQIGTVFARMDAGEGLKFAIQP